METSSHHPLFERIRAEYLEMPGMRLTIQQVGRLCGADQATCLIVLDALVDLKFLDVHGNGTYARVADLSTSQRGEGRPYRDSPYSLAARELRATRS